jgi:hypothetical protein
MRLLLQSMASRVARSQRLTEVRKKTAIEMAASKSRIYEPRPLAGRVTDTQCRLEFFAVLEAQGVLGHFDGFLATRYEN